jgi:hypothetical protein
MVDRPVFLDAVRRPLSLKLQLAVATLALGDRHEVRRDPPRVDDLVGNAVAVELPVARGLLKGRVEGRVVDDGVAQDLQTLSLTTPSSRGRTGDYRASD